MIWKLFHSQSERNNVYGQYLFEKFSISTLTVPNLHQAKVKIEIADGN